MSNLSKTLNSLYGAYRLARFDAGGLQFFDNSLKGFWHSFQAAILVLPLFMTTTYARWIFLDLDVSAFRFTLIEMIAYIIAWTAYPVIMTFVARYFEREQNYIRTIIAYNWAAVLQNLIYTPVAILNLSGASGAGPLTLIALFMILTYSWFVARKALDIHPSAAWIIVGVDILISMALSLWVETLLSRG
ncbi:MAG: hypothetical protein HON65_15280 [Rhodospirillales bacterium]|jgi:hypothetical protein|nr:hypothetical protein [Rhodospirillales bacterium]